MIYPLISEYTEAILSAEENFDELSYLRPVLDDSGHLIMSSGNFAVVYKMMDIRDGKYYAIKCFTRNQDGRQDAYAAISNYLEGRHKKHLISVKYLVNELFVDTAQTDDTEFPVLLMDWIDGACLEEYINENLSNVDELETLYENFVDFVTWLIPTNFAHGDLKPDNIIVNREGEIILIDYDGMYVPSMSGQLSPELGTPQFQYSKRNSLNFNEFIDDYAGIYLALILKFITIEHKPMSFYLMMDCESLVAYSSKFIGDVGVSKLLSAYLMVNSLGFIERESLSNVFFDEIKRNLKLELRLISESLEGNDQSMIQLGDTYSKGMFTPKNTFRAFHWYNIAKYMGNQNASCSVCRYIFHLKNDSNLSINPIHSAMLQKNVDFSLCREGEESMLRNKEHSIYYFEKAASLNFAPAIGWMGISSQLGTKDVRLIKKAAELNYCRSIRHLGDYYRDGKEVQQDINEYIKLYKRAAELGDPEAQYQVGRAYMYGIGDVSKDVTEAVMWFNKAIEQNHEGAAYEIFIYHLDEKFPWLSDSKAYSVLCRFKDSTDAKINHALGFCHHEGVGRTVNPILAKKYYLKAIHSWGGYSDSEINLESLCKEYGIKDETILTDEEQCSCANEGFIHYSKDGRRLLSYLTISSGEYAVEDGCEVLCDDSFNDIYDMDYQDIETLILPESLKRIGNNVFCASINNIVNNSPNFIVKEGFLLSKDERVLFRYFGDSKHVEIPKSVEYIKGGAFSSKCINEILIPKSVGYIGDNPFAGVGAEGLSLSGNRKTTNIINKSKHFKIVDNVLYDIREKRLISYFGHDSVVNILNDTYEIGRDAFFGAVLKKIDFCSTKIEKIHESAFNYCVVNQIIVDLHYLDHYREILPMNLASCINVDLQS